MSKKIRDSIIRHAATGLGGILLYVGIPELAAGKIVEAAAPVIAGTVIYGIGQITSIIEKKSKKIF